MALNPNVVVVAPNELITATHLNNIRSNLLNFDTAIAARVPMSGVSSAVPITGNLYLGGDPVGGPGALVSPGGLIQLARTGSGPIGSPNLQIGRGSAPGAGAASEPLVSFARSASGLTPFGTQIGSITINTGANGVLYNQTSDPRTKTRVGDIGDAAARIQTLGRAAFRGHLLHADTGEPVGDERDLLSSHDIEDVAGYAVTGERDAVDDNGEPVYQQVAYGELVPLLCAALAAALDRIDALEAAA